VKQLFRIDRRAKKRAFIVISSTYIRKEMSKEIRLPDVSSLIKGGKYQLP